jgi:hypothetical protein
VVPHPPMQEQCHSPASRPTGRALLVVHPVTHELGPEIVHAAALVRLGDDRQVPLGVGAVQELVGPERSCDDRLSLKSSGLDLQAVERDWGTWVTSTFSHWPVKPLHMYVSTYCPPVVTLDLTSPGKPLSGQCLFAQPRVSLQRYGGLASHLDDVWRRVGESGRPTLVYRDGADLHPYRRPPRPTMGSADHGGRTRQLVRGRPIMFERSPQLRSCALTEGGVAVRDFAATVRRALERARRLHRPRSGRRSLVLGTALLIASTVTVVATANTPPEFTSLTVTPSVLNEGQTVTLSGTFTDSDTSDAHTVYIFWNDAPIEASRTKVQLPAGQTTFQVNHTYTDNLLAGATGIRVKVADRQLPLGSNDNTEGYGRDRESVPIQVKNVAPRFVDSSIVGTASAGGVVVEGDFTEPGTSDVVQVKGTVGNPINSSSLVAMSCSLLKGERRFRCEHTQRPSLAPRTYTINLRVSDDDGGFDTHSMSVHFDGTTHP